MASRDSFSMRSVRSNGELLCKVDLGKLQRGHWVHVREQLTRRSLLRLVMELQWPVDHAATLDSRVRDHAHIAPSVGALRCARVHSRPRARVLCDLQQRPRDPRQQRQQLLEVLLGARVDEELRAVAIAALEIHI